jgi:pimeloyl-ACP methyl ester carboxylesterase
MTNRSPTAADGPLGARAAEPASAAAVVGPVPAIAGSLLAGLTLAIALAVVGATSASEATITGSVLLSFGIGWGLMALLTTRFSSQPQPWAKVPGAVLGAIGLGLVVVQPGPAVVDLLGWLWPPTIAILAIWMIAQVRRQLRGRARWLVMPVIGTLLGLSLGGGAVTVGAAIGREASATSGRLVDVGGRRLFIECTGSGSPAVVLQSGLAESSSYWSLIAPAVAESSTVCVYDRAGHGRSDTAGGPQDGIALATDLRTALERARVPGPYVLVGHSSGGPYVRVFGARYGDLVAGMVLLDAQPADAFTSLPDYPRTYQTLRLAYGLAPSLARTGLLGIALGLPADQSTPAAAHAARDELATLPTVLQQAQALTSLGGRPLVVVTAGSGQQAGWLAAQDAMANLSTSIEHRIIAAATHTSLITGGDAGASTEAILAVLESIRTGGPLR